MSSAKKQFEEAYKIMTEFSNEVYAGIRGYVNHRDFQVSVNTQLIELMEGLCLSKRVIPQVAKVLIDRLIISNNQLRMGGQRIQVTEEDDAFVGQARPLTPMFNSAPATIIMPRDIDEDVEVDVPRRARSIAFRMCNFFRR